MILRRSGRFKKKLDNIKGNRKSLMRRWMMDGWDIWLFNLAWSLLFMRREPFRSLFTHKRMRWYEMKGQPNRDSNPVPPSQETNHATNWANEAGEFCNWWEPAVWTPVIKFHFSGALSQSTFFHNLQKVWSHSWCPHSCHFFLLFVIVIGLFFFGQMGAPL